jgi:hypothetical protein
LEIWRIENKKPVPWPAEKFGQFHAGDSYLILQTTISKSGKYEWDLYFWLGKESSVDEMGIAAYKTVFLLSQHMPRLWFQTSTSVPTGTSAVTLVTNVKRAEKSTAKYLRSPAP